MSDVQLHLEPTKMFSVLAGLPDCSVDAVVTDPPYGLEFMGKEWDGADGFRRALNANDAGRDNAFGRTSRTSPEYRTASRATAGMSGTGYTDGANRIERPSFMGGLNPKCLVCDRWQRGSSPCSCESPEWTQERLVRLHSFQEWCEVWARECLRVLKPGGHLLAFGGTRTSHRLTSAIEDAGFEIRDAIAWMYGSGFPKSRNLDGDWQGWGTAMKPGFEPITVARKPLAGTVAANVERFGTGALNIDGCRVGDREAQTYTTRRLPTGSEVAAASGWARGERETIERDLPAGRWPANVVLDGEMASALDEQSGELTSGKMMPTHTTAGTDGRASCYGADAAGGFTTMETYGDTGGASRFYLIADYTEDDWLPITTLAERFRYVAKADNSERVRVDGVAHPTVKPLALMRWLVRLVTPPGGTVLEPFAGSGTTVEACLLEGFDCIAIEREAEYLPLIQQRIDRRRNPVAAIKGSGEDGGLFDLLDQEPA